MNDITVKLNQIYKNGTTLSTSIKTNNLLFADDQVIIADSEDNLQRGVFTLQNTANKILECKYHQKNLRRCHF
jgi:hypothetical protein